MFATSTLLLPMSKLGLCSETMPLLRSVEMGVEILEAMDESVVARKSVDIIRQYLRDFRATGAPHTGGEDETPSVETAPGQGFEVPVCNSPHYPNLTDINRNGPTVSVSQIILSRELLDYLTMWVDFRCLMSSLYTGYCFLVHIDSALFNWIYELQNLTSP
jgi:hypothetical protein